MADPGYTMICDTTKGEIRLAFAGKTYTLKGVPKFGVLRRLQENADALQAKEDGGAKVGFDLMVQTLEWWRYAAESLGVTLPEVDDLPLGLALLGPQQEALTHWLVCSVPTPAPGARNGQGPKARPTSRTGR